MKKKLLISLFAQAAAGLIGLNSVQAQTTNFLANAFNNADEVTNQWGNWFGSGYKSVAWDASNDSGGNPNSGSMLVTTTNTDQYLVFNGYGRWSLSAVTFTNLQFDIRYDATSAIRTNGNTLDYGFVQVGCRTPSYNQDYFGGFQITATNGNGTPNTNWTRVNIKLNAVSDSNLTNIVDLIFHAYHPGYGNQNMVGLTKYWIDNIQFVGPSSVSNPPPVVTIGKAVPGLRMFAAGGQYIREDLVTSDQNASWVGGTYPVTYSFTLASAPKYGTFTSFQEHLFLIPKNSLPYGPYANSYADYDATNLLWLQIISTSSNYFANVAYKTNHTASNPDHTVAQLYTGGVTGTWSLTFNSATDGKLTAPDGTFVNFSLPSDVSALFANPVLAYFGVQPNTPGNIGQFVDISQITVTNTAGTPVIDVFSTDTSLDSSKWTKLADSGAIQLVTSDTPWWVSWTLPDFGFDLGTKENVADTSSPWINPGYYSGYFITPIVTQVGTKKWALIPTECLPSTNSAYFILQNPPVY